MGVLRQQQDQVHAALDHIEQVVEVVRDAARETTDRFHFLQLHHGQLHPFAFDHFVHQAVVGLRQCPRAFFDARFERLVQLQQFGAAVAQAVGGQRAFGQDAARLVLAPPRAQRGSGGAAQGLGIERAFEQDDIAQLVEGAARGLGMAAAPGHQHHERKIGPRLLGAQPCQQLFDAGVAQRLLGDHAGARALLQAGHQRFHVGHRAADKSVAQQHLVDHLGVAPMGREDQDPLLDGGIRRGHRHRSPSWAWHRDR